MTIGPSRHAVQNGLIAAVFALSVYLLVVVVTTPSLSPRDAIYAAFEVNWWVLAGITLGVGVQIYLASYGKAACGLGRGRSLSGATSFTSAFSSFFSMFSLVSVGCCGTWLYILSFLPGVLGTGASAVLIGYSNLLVAIGFALMAISILYTYASVMSAKKRNAHPTANVLRTT